MNKDKYVLVSLGIENTLVLAHSTDDLEKAKALALRKGWFLLQQVDLTSDKEAGS